MTGLTANEEKVIRDIITKNAPDCDVIAFGSRADGTHRDTSDLDLAFIMPNGAKLSISQIGTLKESFQESDLLFRVDVIDYNAIEQYFRDIIDTSFVCVFPAIAPC